MPQKAFRRIDEPAVRIDLDLSPKRLKLLERQAEYSERTVDGVIHDAVEWYITSMISSARTLAELTAENEALGERPEGNHVIGGR